jgi:acetyl-CoA C-acetyltransferase
LVTSVSGLLTKPGLGVWASTGDGEPPLIDDLAGAAEAATATRAVLADYDGAATIVAATVTFDGLDPSGLVVLAVTPDGDAVIARSVDPALVERGRRSGGLVGVVVRVSLGTVSE